MGGGGETCIQGSKFCMQSETGQKKSERSKSMEKAVLHFVPSSLKADDMLLTFLQQRKKCINFRLVSGHIIWRDGTCELEMALKILKRLKRRNNNKKPPFAILLECQNVKVNVPLEVN